MLGDITAAAAQQTAPPFRTSKSETPASRPSTAPSDVNIQIDATIQSQGSNTPLFSKSITTIVTHGGAVSFACSLVQAVPHVNGDFKAAIRDGRVDVAFSRDVYIMEANSPEVRYRGNNRLLVDNGKAMIVSKVPDPLTNRTVTVVISATILK